MIKVSIPHAQMVKLQKEIEAKAKKYENKVKRIVDSTATAIETDAKNEVSGFISQGRFSGGTYRQGFQNTITKNGLSAVIYHEKFYAPYVEFGTGTDVFINEVSSFNFNSDDRRYASQFRRGPGRNANARPALLPAFYKNRDKLIQRLKKLDL
jgi:hypothetical protein